MSRKLTKQDITERFLLICEEVIREGLCKTKKEFAISIGEHPQNLTLMAKGSRFPTLEQIAKACDLYGYSPTWLILNMGSKKLAGNEKDATEERVSELELEVEKLKKFLIKKIATGT